MAVAALENIEPKNTSLTVKPMPFWQALLYFGLPAILFRICLYSGIPALTRLGLTPFQAWGVSFIVPSATLFALAFGFTKRDDYPLTWDAIKIRFRLLPMTGKDWLWAIGGFLLTFLSIGVLGFTAPLLIGAFPIIAPPAFFPPWQQPGVIVNTAVFANYIGAPLLGNWGVIILVFLVLFFNIFGEELWWRGYILPRQEIVHGRWTWAIHGMLWLFWHVVFYPWQLFALLPICLILPYVAQRRQNTWVAVVIHLQNGIILLLILMMVLGIV